MKYKHIIWDYNGTLLNDLWLCIDTLNSLLGRRGLTPITEEQYKAQFTFPVKDFYIGLGLDFSIESFEELSVEYISEYNNRRHECQLHNGAEKTLALLAQHQISQSILSAREKKELTSELSFYGIFDYFSYREGTDNHLANGKIDLGKKLIDKIGLKPNEIVLIGDTVHDFEVAQEMGTDCILVQNGHHPGYRLASCGVPLLNNVSELLMLITPNV